jgi:hypothetical protein
VLDRGPRIITTHACRKASLNLLQRKGVKIGEQLISGQGHGRRSPPVLAGWLYLSVIALRGKRSHLGGDFDLNVLMGLQQYPANGAIESLCGVAALIHCSEQRRPR